MKFSFLPPFNYRLIWLTAADPWNSEGIVLKMIPLSYSNRATRKCPPNGEREGWEVRPAHLTFSFKIDWRPSTPLRPITAKRVPSCTMSASSNATSNCRDSPGKQTTNKVISLSTYNLQFYSYIAMHATWSRDKFSEDMMVPPVVGPQMSSTVHLPGLRLQRLHLTWALTMIRKPRIENSLRITKEGGRRIALNVTIRIAIEYTHIGTQIMSLRVPSLSLSPM